MFLFLYFFMIFLKDRKDSTLPPLLSWEMELDSTCKSANEGLPSHMVSVALVLTVHVVLQVVTESLNNSCQHLL